MAFWWSPQKWKISWLVPILILPVGPGCLRLRILFNLGIRGMRHQQKSFRGLGSYTFWGLLLGENRSHTRNVFSRWKNLVICHGLAPFYSSKIHMYRVSVHSIAPSQSQLLMIWMIIGLCDRGKKCKSVPSVRPFLQPVYLLWISSAEQVNQILQSIAENCEFLDPYDIWWMVLCISPIVM